MDTLLAFHRIVTVLPPYRFNIIPCTAKTPMGQQPDIRLKDGVR